MRRSVIPCTLRVQTYLLGLLVLALAGATALAWHQYQELVTLRAGALGGDERAALDARLEQLKRRNYELETQLAAAQGAMSAPATDVADSDTKERTDEQKAAEAAALANLIASDDGTGLGSKRDADMELLAAMSDLPEFQKLIALQQRGKIDAKYAALFKKLKLSSDQQQKLEMLLADKQSAFADAMIAARNQGLTGKDAREMANAVAKATQKDIDNSIKGLLGQQGYNQYQNYERTIPQRDTVNQLAQRLSYTGAPLTPRQQEQLVQTLATAQNQAAKANAVATGTAPVKQKPANATVAPLPAALSGLGISSGSTAVISNAALSKSKSFLSPQQVNELQQMQQEQRAQQTLSNLLRTGTVNGPAPKPKPAKKG